MTKVNCALRPSAQAFDEVRIITVPRYKESELSGDEWRYHAEIQLWRKGEKIVSRAVRDVEMAVAFAAAFYHESVDNGLGYFAGDGIHCDQEGCSEIATAGFMKKANYCTEGHKSEPHEPVYRHFCERHSRRGDCGLDDSDSNYSEPQST